MVLDGDYLNLANVIVSVEVGIVFVLLYFSMTMPSTSTWFEETPGIKRGPSAFVPVHLIFTCIVVLIFSGIIYMIYRIQVAANNRTIIFSVNPPF